MVTGAKLIALQPPTERTLTWLRTARRFGSSPVRRVASASRSHATRSSAVTAFELPTPDGLRTTYFLRLQLQDAAGKLVSDNFYWLSTKADTLDWSHKQDTVYTPQADFGDLTGLATLPEVKLDVTASTKRDAGKNTTRVTVKNLGSSIAFMVHLRAARTQAGTDITPILWEDNYFSLLPGEQREVSATYATTALAGDSAVLQVEGFNIAKQTVESNTAAGGDN